MKSGQSALPTEPQFLCQYLNISECLPIENQEQFTLTLYNPTIHPVVHYARIPVTRDYTIRDPDGQIVMADFIPISKPTLNIPGRTSVAELQLVFRTILPALGFNTYYFEVKSTATKPSVKKVSQNEACRVRVDFDEEGNLNQITNLDKNITFPMKQGFFYYKGFPGNNSRSDFQASGAYMFRPNSSDTYPVSNTRTINCTKTDIVQTAQIIYNEWVSQEIRVYNDQLYVESEWTIGPISINDAIGKEIIVRYDTDIKSDQKYYTDANGREIIERMRDYRPGWNYTVNEAVSGNYYPVNSRIYIKEEGRQLTILTDRSEGGTSMQDGTVEIMIHRRLLYDDSQGVGEPLNETAYNTGLVVRGKHFILVDDPDSSALQHRPNSQELYMSPISTFSLIKSTYENYTKNYRQSWSAVNQTLPLNVHLLTFDLLEMTAENVGKYLIRLEHYFELYEDSVYSNPVTFDLQSLFLQGKIVDLVELTLGANLQLKDLNRLQWTTTNGESSNKN
ncbi:unnamed protein product, partial [Didymodactylos carnosus]